MAFFKKMFPKFFEKMMYGKEFLKSEKPINQYQGEQLYQSMWMYLEANIYCVIVRK